ncbi:SGNH/GDSL hydrolase family protein [Pseudomonas matsuisoli]|uniref:SGNH/GDSL hydrolase family protein n=1 Tax=Pseudomonas matsuisoli TaxID=1515666 RepID=A0A917UW59_9PSED|nr:SGNH/GDSL hydrolase family protein [Pseudomonas matsuisoli]GGJ91146.1 hypothetical protein GCM10009304_16070 [Pseudomonas matsuisoli]
MKKMRLALLGVLLGAVALPAAAVEPLRVLFVGNSYTFYNRLPELVKQMSIDAEQARPLEVADVTFGGASLEQHWQLGDVQAALAKADWDYVVIQDHSLMPINDPEKTRKYIKLVADAARADGAQPILYLTWARQNNPAMQARLDEVYTTLAEETRSLLAPVGQAWQRALADLPQPTLFTADGSHPSYTGSYLAASVFYSLIYGTRPPVPAGIVRQLDQASASELQADAWASIQSLNVALRTVPDALNVATAGIPAVQASVQASR